MRPDNLASMGDCPMLTLRPTGLSSPAYWDWLDYVIVEDGRDVGLVYEDRHNRPELRWFWSITIYVNPKRGITTSWRASSLEEAKAQFLANWQKYCTDFNSICAALWRAGRLFMEFSLTSYDAPAAQIAVFATGVTRSAGAGAAHSRGRVLVRHLSNTRATWTADHFPAPQERPTCQ